MKKILIFYSKTGGGHLRAAEAIAEGLKLQNPSLEVVLCDGLAQNMIGQTASPTRTYSVLTGPLLPLYNHLLYPATNTQKGMTVFRPMINMVIGKSLREVIKKEKPDLIISTHHFISPSTIGTLKGMPPLVTVITDLSAPHRVWFDRKSRLIIAPNEEAARHLVKIFKAEPAKVRALGYPLKSNFQAGKKTVSPLQQILYLGGGCKPGKTKKQILELCRHFPQTRIIVVCAFNQRLQKILTPVKESNFEVHGFTDQMKSLMEQSDVVITKAGPGVIMEAAVLKRPIILTEWVGLQEKDNVNFVLKNKLGLFCPTTKKLIAGLKKISAESAKFNTIEFENGTGTITAHLLNL